MDSYFKNFDLTRQPSVNPKTQLQSLINGQSLIKNSGVLLKRSRVPANRLNGTFLEEYALNLLKFLVWNDLGYDSLVLTLGAEIPLWEGYVWEKGNPRWESATWKPDVAVGRYYQDEERKILNSGYREFTETKTWQGVFIPLVLVSCKFRVTTAEFYDTRARFEILRKTSPYILAVELANQSLIAKAHLKADAMVGNAYFLEEGKDVVERFVEDIREHLREHM